MTTNLFGRLGTLEISDAQLEAAAGQPHIGPTQLQTPICHMIDTAIEVGGLQASPQHTLGWTCTHADDGILEEATRPTAGPTQLQTPICHMIESRAALR
jgi:hypothetical protein